MSISLVIPVHDDVDGLSRCLESIQASTVKPREVIVVDDASTKDVRSIVDRFGFEHVRLKVRGGPGKARNSGAARATGDVVFFVDSDVVINRDTIQRVEHGFKDPTIIILQGIASKNPTNPGFGPALLALKWYFMLHKHAEASFLYSHACAIRREVFLSSGGFNETFTPPGFGEEFELGARLRRDHVIHVDAGMQVDHRFQGLAARTRSVFHRACTWARVFLDTGRFEKENASSRDVAGGILVILGMVGLLSSVVVHPWSLVASLVFFISHLMIISPFLRFISQEKGKCFAVKAIIPIAAWDLVACIGGLAGVCKHVLGIEGLARRGLAGTVKFRFSSSPSHLVLFVTARCNGACGHCFYWRSLNKPGTRELSTSEMIRLARSLPRVEMLTITGGEPTLRGDLYEVVKAFYLHSNTRHVTLHTNGLDPARLFSVVRKSASCLRDLEINVSVSLDGFPSTHDTLRGVKDAFTKAVESIKAVIRVKHRYGTVSVTVNACCTRVNCHELPRLARWFHARFDIDNVYMSLVRGECLDETLKHVDVDAYQRAVNLVNEHKSRAKGYGNYSLASFRTVVDLLSPRDVVQAVKNKRMRYPCNAGRSVIVVSETGDVFPCEMRGEGFGNLRDHEFDIKAMVRARGARQLLASIKAGACWCTWECAVMNNVIFTPRAIPRVLLAWINYISRRTLGGA